MGRSIGLHVGKSPRSYTQQFLDSAGSTDTVTQLWTPGSPSTFTLGQTLPVAANSGVPTGTVLTTHTGDLVVTVAGTVIDSLDIHGFVSIQAANVTIQNCRIRGRGTSFVYYGLVDCRSAACVNALIQFCTLKPDNSEYWLNGIDGGNFMSYRNDISYCTDGHNSSIGNVGVHGCYYHDVGMRTDSQDQANSTPPYWTHNDFVQLKAGSNYSIVGNNVQCYAAPDCQGASALTAAGYVSAITGKLLWVSGITVSPTSTPVTGVTIDSNWFEGGNSNFQCSVIVPTGGPMNLGAITNNRYGMDQYNYGNNSRYQIRYKNGMVATGLTSNYFDPNAASVPDALKGVFFTTSFTGGIRVDA